MGALSSGPPLHAKLAALALVMVVIVTPSAAGCPWPMDQGGPAHQGACEPSTGEGPTALAWQARLGAPIQASIAPFEGSLVVLTRGAGAVELSMEGDVATRFEGPVSGGAGPVTMEGRAFIADGDGTVYAFQPGDPAPVWSRSLGASVNATPAASDGALYIGATDGTVLALGQSAGEVLWSLELPAGVEAGLVVADGVLLVGTDDGTLYALDPTTGQPAWIQPLGPQDPPILGVPERIRAAPAAADGRVFVHTYKNNLYAFDLETGQELWRSPRQERPGGKVVTASPTVVEDRVYVTGRLDANLYGIRAGTGERVQRVDVGEGLLSSPAWAQGMLYTGQSPESVVAVDTETGEIAERLALPFAEAIQSSPLILGELLIFGTDGGRVLAISLEPVEGGDEEVGSGPRAETGGLSLGCSLVVLAGLAILRRHH